MSIFEKMQLEKWTPANDGKVLDALQASFGEDLRLLGYQTDSLRVESRTIKIDWKSMPMTLYPLSEKSETAPAIQTIINAVAETLKNIRLTLQAFEQPLRDALGMSKMERCIDLMSEGSGEPEGVRITANPNLIPKKTKCTRVFSSSFTTRENRIHYEPASVAELQEALQYIDGLAWIYINTDTCTNDSVDIELYESDKS